MSGERRKTGLVLIDQILVSGVNFATGLLLARFLGSSGYGEYVLAFGIVLFVSGVQMALIISPMMVTGPSLSKDGSRAYYSSVLLLQLLLCVVAGILIFVLGKALAVIYPHWGLQNILWPLTIAAVSFIAQDFVRRTLFAQDRPGGALINDAISYGLRFLGLLILGFTANLDAPMALWVVAGASILALLVAIIQFLPDRSFAMPDRIGVSNATNEHWTFGKWLIANNLAYWGSSQLIIYMVGAIMSASAVGVMSAALNLVGVANILFLAMENLVPSRAARAYSTKGREGLNRYLRRVAILGGLGTFAIVAIAGIWSEYWLQLVYGQAYMGYGWIVALWGVYYFVGFFQRPLSAGLRVLGNTRGVFVSSIGGAVVAVFLSYPAIKWGGIAGAMFTLCCIQVAVLMITWKAYGKSIGASRIEIARINR